MIFVFGGCYQGKTDFIKEKFIVNEKDIYYCKNDVNFSYKVLNLDDYIPYLVDNDVLVSKYIEENINLFKDKIIFMTDTSCGVVPVDTRLRKIREEVSRVMVLFSKNSNEVYRVHCGISVKLK